MFPVSHERQARDHHHTFKVGLSARPSISTTSSLPTHHKRFCVCGRAFVSESFDTAVRFPQHDGHGCCEASSTSGCPSRLLQDTYSAGPEAGSRS